MKGFLAIAIIASAIYLGSAAVTKELATKIKAVSLECKEEHGVDDATYMDLMASYKVPTSEEGKCMVACFLRKMGYMSGKKFDVDAMEESNKQKWQEAENIEKANKLVDTCVQEADSSLSECQMGADMITCFVEKAPAEGLPLPKVE